MMLRAATDTRRAKSAAQAKQASDHAGVFCRGLGNAVRGEVTR